MALAFSWKARLQESEMRVHPRNGAPDRETPSAHTYSPAILSRLQSTLAALADLDCDYERDLETVASSGVPDAIKQEVIRTLQQRQQVARAPYVRQLAALHRKAVTALAAPSMP
jgi:hypothetical protein